MVIGYSTVPYVISLLRNDLSSILHKKDLLSEVFFYFLLEALTSATSRDFFRAAAFFLIIPRFAALSIA